MIWITVVAFLWREKLKFYFEKPSVCYATDTFIELLVLRAKIHINKNRGRIVSPTQMKKNGF